MKVDSIEPKTAAAVTDAVLSAWKKEYPDAVFELNTSTETLGELKGWIRKPTRNEMRQLSSKNVDPITYSENALEAIWLGGDIAIKTDDEAFYSVSAVIQGVLNIKAAELKKL